jgi:hypothetical protein
MLVAPGRFLVRPWAWRWHSATRRLLEQRRQPCQQVRLVGIPQGYVHLTAIQHQADASGNGAAAITAWAAGG